MAAETFLDDSATEDEALGIGGEQPNTSNNAPSARTTPLANGTVRIMKLSPENLKNP
jgi:hypothetical protein